MPLNDGSLFVPSYPAWVLVHKSSLRRDAAGDIRIVPPLRFVMSIDEDGNQCMPVFSDGDLAQRFKNATAGMDEAVILAAETPEKLAEGLEMVRGIAAKVSFDAEKATGPNRRVWDLEYVIQKIRAGEGL
jgi:hypothetical protein